MEASKLAWNRINWYYTSRWVRGSQPYNLPLLAPSS